MDDTCIIALDLGTTAFKCAPVGPVDLLAEPTSVSYTLDYEAGAVTFDTEKYLRIAESALIGAIDQARALGRQVEAIGISSQAQTYIPLGWDGQPLQRAVVWTDDRAVEEAEEVQHLIPDYVHHSGFQHPLPAMFMPKVKHFARHSDIRVEQVWKFVLLNEYIIYRLTGQVYGDETNQGMSGFYHLVNRRYSDVALAYAGISENQLAQVFPAALYGAPLTREWSKCLGIPAVPVYSCGNDQSCAATGAGLSAAGDILSNFGTAMVVYALKDELPLTLLEKQIAGIHPLTGRYFLLGVEAECGNVLDWAYRVMYRDTSFSGMLEDALREDSDATHLPHISLPGSGRIEIRDLTVGCERSHLVRSLLDLYAREFGLLLSGVQGGLAVNHLYAAGGLSRSQRWLQFLSQQVGFTFQRTLTEQPGLVGVGMIVSRRRKR